VTKGGPPAWELGTG